MNLKLIITLNLAISLLHPLNAGDFLSQAIKIVENYNPDKTTSRSSEETRKPSSSVEIEGSSLKRQQIKVPESKAHQKKRDNKNNTQVTLQNPSHPQNDSKRRSVTRGNIGARPSATVQREVIQRPITPPAQARYTKPSPTILSTPRPLPKRSLPALIQLDNQCVAYKHLLLNLYAISPRGHVIELVDGSVWHVSSKSDRRKVRRWNYSDDIMIESSQYFIWTTYRLINFTRNESIEASMTVGPINERKASH